MAEFGQTASGSKQKDKQEKRSSDRGGRNSVAEGE